MMRRVPMWMRLRNKNFVCESDHRGVGCGPPGCDDSVAEQPTQQSPSNTRTGGIASNIYDTHEFNAAGVQNLFF
jgi:hypothetical protein